MVVLVLLFPKALVGCKLREANDLETSAVLLKPCRLSRRSCAASLLRPLELLSNIEYSHELSVRILAEHRWCSIHMILDASTLLS
jgi:hypothetical protein